MYPVTGFPPLFSGFDHCSLMKLVFESVTSGLEGAPGGSNNNYYLVELA